MKEKVISYKIRVDSKSESKKLASKLVSYLEGGEVICLIGELGAGKTYFTKYIADALGIDSTEIVSPTFVYWRKHKGVKLDLNHFDFYRIDNQSEAESIGVEDALKDNEGITVIEWADKIRSYLPENRIEIKINEFGGEKRVYNIKMIGKRFKDIKL